MADFVDFLSNVWHYAMADAGMQALVTDGIIGKDPHGTLYPQTVYTTGWIFRDVGHQRPARAVESTGKAAVVFSQVNWWSQQVRHHSTKFPILTVFIFADPDRDASGHPLTSDAEDKVRRVWREIDRLFHDPGNRIHTFDDLRIVSTVEGSPLNILPVPDGDGAVRGTVRYDIIL